MSDAGDAAPPRRAGLLLQLLERARAGILVFDACGELVEASEGGVAMFGATVNDLIGRSADELFEPHPSEGPIAAQIERLAGAEVRLSSWSAFVFRRQGNGRVAPANLSLSSHFDPIEERALVLAIVDPVRDFEAVMRSWLQADRLSTIGLLAGSAGHEIKNDLGPLIGYLSLLEAQGSEDPMVPLMRESVRRIHDHVEQVLEPLRPRSRTRGAIVLRRMVDDAVVGLRRAGKLRRVDFRIVDARESDGEDHHDANAVVVHADRDEVDQLLLALLSNADDALGDESGGNRGSIEVRIDSEGDFGVIEVEDDGPGMEAPVRARAFEATFTTKTHRGTGLGLPVVQLIARDLGGDVTLKSTAGVGTKVRLRIPLFRR